MKQKTADKLAQATLLLTLLPLAALSFAWATLHRRFWDDHLIAIAYGALAIHSVNWLSSALCVLAAMALWNKCNKKWHAALTLLINTFLLTSVAEVLYFS